MWRIIQLAVHIPRNISRRMSGGPSPAKFVWIDLELTGLDIDRDEIMEVACLISNPDLHVLEPGFNVVVHLEEDDLRKMNPWCVEQHGKSGLTEACRRSTILLKDAERQLREYITKHCDSSDTLYMAGNSVYMDRLFIDKKMPSISALHHYRLVDVSTIKILASQWYPEYTAPKKKLNHRSLDDLQESINELRAYRSFIFK